jgi:O-antigen ligase
MITNKSTFFLGIFVFLIPFFGVPSAWRTAFVILSGLWLVFISIKINLPKKNVKAKAKKEKVAPNFISSQPVSDVEAGSRDVKRTDFNPDSKRDL